MQNSETNEDRISLMNILLINHYAGSPQMGMEFRPYFMAKEWISQGHRVTILAADHSHIRAHNPKVPKDFAEENIDGIQYVWVKTRAYQGNGASRVFNMLDFVRKIYFKAHHLALKYKPQVVIASSTYPIDNYIARKLAKLSHAKYVYEVHDLWPLSPIELGGMSKKHPFILLLQQAEDYAYKNADIVVSMLPKTQEYMVSRGLDLKKWHYIPNGVALDHWEEPAELNDISKQRIRDIKTKYDKIIAYTGTLGLANALDILMDACLRLDKRIAVVIMGEGPEKERLQQRTVDEKINNCFIFDSITKNEIPAFLSEMDFLFIGLKSQPLFRFGISPNKMIDYMMSAKPIIQAINAGNNMVQEAQCGISIEPENPEAIIDAVNQLMHLSDEELVIMGKNGKSFASENHDYQRLSEKFIRIMKTL